MFRRRPASSLSWSRCCRPRRRAAGHGGGLRAAGATPTADRDQVAALRALTEDLLEISRPDGGRERLDLDGGHLSAVAERAVGPVCAVGPMGAAGTATAGTGAGAGAGADATAGGSAAETGSRITGEGGTETGTRIVAGESGPETGTRVRVLRGV